MNTIIEIKPCPFCGSLGVAIVGSFVRCGSCGAVGPYGYTNEEAVQRWNCRTSAAAAPLDANAGAVVNERHEHHRE